MNLTDNRFSEDDVMKYTTTKHLVLTDLKKGGSSMYVTSELLSLTKQTSFRYENTYMCTLMSDHRLADFSILSKEINNMVLLFCRITST